ncbi:protein FAR-RED IMPAIRED RESPONSE 1-like [Impatiens glandulifera]|uniref:protein FAR-RED IMPAIRED RESPONSE 1-like n=1 Tax=Impatiens glandulifera TaxID=253017 RepID=UPI001FB0CE88|nr:protein FAR-RED IMPAIRED RESPONSE 1-like [Impatiens glandulifera]
MENTTEVVTVKDDTNEKNIYNQNLEDQNLNINEVQTPKVGMIYSSEEDVRNYYIDYGKHVGFAIAKKSSKNGDDGKTRYFSLACARNGKTISTAKNCFYPRPSTKTDCKAKINVTVREDGWCIISRVYLDHNHTLCPGKVQHFRCKKVLTSDSKGKSELIDPADAIVSSRSHLSSSEANPPSVEKDFVRIGKSRIGDVEALFSYFSRVQSRNANFYYTVDVNEDCRIKNIFWADARCRTAYESFGDVVTFDTSYLTNGYEVPLVVFSGVNHHGQSILFGCGLISNDDTDTFIWLFKSWLICMSGRSPKSLIIDERKTIRAAVIEVFPNSHYRLCLWNIMKMALMKLGNLVEYEAIKNCLKNAVYDSLKPNEFEESWLRFVMEHKLEGNEWLQSLYADRHLWVPAFVKEYFWGGSEKAMNSFFDGYVHSKTTLRQFVEQYDIALKSKIEKEDNSDFASFGTTIPLITNLSIEKQFQQAYTNDLFKLFQEELRGLIYCNASMVKSEDSVTLYEVTESKLENDGSSWKEINEIPSHYILKRWRKDIKRGYTFVKNNEERGQCNLGLWPLLCEVLELGSVSDGCHELVVSLLGEVKQKLLDCDALQAAASNHDLKQNT